MADNFPLTPGSGRLAATDQVAYSGDTADVQLLRIVGVTGGEGAKTVEEPPPFGRAATAALANVTYSASSTMLKALNASRRALIIVNDTDVDLFVKFGATASSTDYTFKLAPGEALRETQYTGRVDGIWVSGGTGAARTTELTA